MRLFDFGVYAMYFFAYFKIFFINPIDKCIRMWYNTVRTVNTVNTDIQNKTERS